MEGVWSSSSPTPPPTPSRLLPLDQPRVLVAAFQADQPDVPQQQSSSPALRPPRPLPTSGVASLDAGSAVMAAGPERRRINVHARGGGGSGAETTGLQASWMHYSSAHRQWWPRGGTMAAERSFSLLLSLPLGLSLVISLPHL